MVIENCSLGKFNSFTNMEKSTYPIFKNGYFLYNITSISFLDGGRGNFYFPHNNFTSLSLSILL